MQADDGRNINGYLFGQFLKAPEAMAVTADYTEEGIGCRCSHRGGDLPEGLPCSGSLIWKSYTNSCSTGYGVVYNPVLR